MALCFTHTAAGYLAYEAVRPADRHRPALLGAAVLLANGADVDFLPGILIGQPGVFHRGVTHTLAAVLAVAAVAWLVGRWRARPGWPATRAAWWAGAIYTSHLLLDFVTTDSRPPFGGRFLWPLSNAYYLAPVTPLPEIVIDPSDRGAFLHSLVEPHTAVIWAGEVATLLAVVVAVHALRAVLATPPEPAGEIAPVGEVADPP